MQYIATSEINISSGNRVIKIEKNTILSEQMLKLIDKISLERYKKLGLIEEVPSIEDIKKSVEDTKGGK